MKFKSIHLEEGMFERDIDFTSNVNLIYSNDNTCGKTTLIRFMLYGLGYNIPGTKDINFNECEVTMIIELDDGTEATLIRNRNSTITLIKNGDHYSFALPTQQYELQSMIFGIENRDILENLLGSFYVDQEKGWTLLNRGKVIGSISFNIEQLLRGLDDMDCSDLLNKINDLEKTKKRLEGLKNITEYHKQIERESWAKSDLGYIDELASNIDCKNILMRNIQREIRTIDQNLAANTKFYEFIEDMKICISLPDGSHVRVTRDNVIGQENLQKVLETRKMLLCEQLNKINNEIDNLTKNLKNEIDTNQFFNGKSSYEDYIDSKLVKIPMDQQAVEYKLNNVKRDLATTRNELRKKSADTKYTKFIYETTLGYAKRLGVSKEIEGNMNALLTSNLKSLSGTYFYKIIMSFRFGYIKAIEKKTGIKLPIIIDSPYAKEISEQNLSMIMDILKQDFSKNQIIIASIYKYDFDKLNVIELKGQLIDQIKDNTNL